MQIKNLQLLGLSQLILKLFNYHKLKIIFLEDNIGLNIGSSKNNQNRVCAEDIFFTTRWQHIITEEQKTDSSLTIFYSSGNVQLLCQ